MITELISIYSNPYQTIWEAMHNDYSEFPISYESINGRVPSEKECGQIIVKRLLKGNRGHYGCLEHVPIVFYIKGGTRQDFITLLDKPGISLLANSGELYLKCNIRSFLMMLDLVMKSRNNMSEYQYKRVLEMYTLLYDHISDIIDWYNQERVDFLHRSKQKDF